MDFNPTNSSFSQLIFQNINVSNIIEQEWKEMKTFEMFNFFDIYYIKSL